MITVAPGATFEAVAQGFPTGLAGTIGVRILDNAGGTTLARTTAGISEIVASSGIYAVSLTAPTAIGFYSIVWDDGSISGPSDVASEDLFVSYSASTAVVASNAYVAVADLKETLSLTGETYADNDITAAINAASRAIDGVCSGDKSLRRRFYADADANQVRYYRPIDTKLVRIDDLITLTTLQTDDGGDGTFEDTWTVNVDFTLEPINAAADGRPYELIRAHPNGNYLFQPDFPRTVKVTGKFGWPAIPDPIRDATSILAARLLKRKRETPLGVVASMESAYRIASTDPDVRGLIHDYIRGGMGLR